MRLFISLLAATGLTFGAFASVGGSFKDPLDSMAKVTKLCKTTQLHGIARAGARLVSVGVRGFIILSDDQGETWRQVPAPVSSDLIAVRFVSPQKGWVSGHDGVILATLDGGQNWVKQLDGRMASEMLTANFTKSKADGVPAAERFLRDVSLNYQNGPEIAMLDLWFENEFSGWAVGPFGTLLRTQDGGQTWVSWIEKVDSDNAPHFNAVRGVGDGIYLASEQGIVFKLDRSTQRFVPLATGYAGSFFGLVGTSDYVIAHGLRGSAYRSRDAGVSWERLSTGIGAGLTSAKVLNDGRLLFVSQDGRMLVSTDQGSSFQSVPVGRPSLFTDVVVTEQGQAVLTGVAGVLSVPLP